MSDAEYSEKFWAGVDAHLFYEKQHGLGFKEQEKEYCKREPSCSNSNDKQKNSYKCVSFVKSDHVLDLNYLNTSSLKTVNKELSNEESDCQLLREKTVPPVSEDTESNVTEMLVCDTKKAYSRDTESKEAEISAHVTVTENKETNAAVSAQTSDTERSAAILLSDETSSFDYEEDIDEIDKALCEAMEAKKVAAKSTKSTSLSSPPQKKVSSESYYIRKGIEEKKGHIAAKDKPLFVTDRHLDMAKTLLDKLEFLYSLHSNLTSLNTLHIQLQTRLWDWQSGALKLGYFKNRLREVDQYIQEYESSLTSGDWIVEWDSFQKRYYYVHKETKVSQSQYLEKLAKDEMLINQIQPEISTSTTKICTSDGDEVPTVSSSISDKELEPNSPFKIVGIEEELQASSNRLCEISPQPPPPGVDTPPPPPPSSPPPHSPPPPPPYEVPEDMDLENSNDSVSSLIISNDNAYEVNQIQYSSMGVFLSSNTEKNLVDSTVASVTSNLQPSCDDSNGISQSLQSFSLTSNSSINDTLTLPLESLSSKTLKDDDLRASATSICSQPQSLLDSCQSSCSSTKLCSSEEIKGKVTQTASGPAPKKEKKKTKLLSVMALKKKKMPLLVEKWQKIREEQEREDKTDHS